jgi:hypothetical protein
VQKNKRQRQDKSKIKRRDRDRDKIKRKRSALLLWSPCVAEITKAERSAQHRQTSKEESTEKELELCLGEILT